MGRLSRCRQRIGVSRDYTGFETVLSIRCSFSSAFAPGEYGNVSGFAIDVYLPSLQRIRRNARIVGEALHQAYIDKGNMALHAFAGPAQHDDQKCNDLTANHRQFLDRNANERRLGVE
jgi:hypothetical protein